MKMGDITAPELADNGKPLDGIRILAIEQMQSLPYATQLMGRMGAEVVKIEHPVRGDLGRGSTPGITDPGGRPVGGTYLRNNLNKRSVGMDLKNPKAIDLIRRMIPRFDVLAENLKPGTLEKSSLGYGDSVSRCIRASSTCRFRASGTWVSHPMATGLPTLPLPRPWVACTPSTGPTARM